MVIKEKIFISYSSVNADLTNRICRMLETSGIKCWIAPRDINPGADWAEAIIDAIDEARTVLVVFTKDANESVQVKREIERAVSKNIPILPLKSGNFKPSKSMEYFLSSHHWHDLDEKHMEKSLESIIQKLGGRISMEEHRIQAGADNEPKEKSAPETEKKWRFKPAYLGLIFVLVALITVIIILKPFGGQEAGNEGEVAFRSPAELMENEGGTDEKDTQNINKSNIEKLYDDDSFPGEGNITLPDDISENLALLSRSDLNLEKKREISELTLKRFANRETPVNLMIGDILDEQIGVYDFMVRLSTMENVTLKTVKVNRDDNGKIKELYVESDQ